MDGKRKSHDDDDVYITVGTSANLFASLPDTTWEHVASFANPPDVYSLSLSSIHFFHEVATNKPPSSSRKSSSSNTAAKKSNNGRRSKRLAAAAAATAASEKNDASSSDDKQVLATSLLRTSLLSSLGNVLEKSKSGITLDVAMKMGELAEGSVLIAGSTLVAAVLGRDFDSPDVDVYCSAKAAPEVRTWLVEQADCMFVGINDGYIDFVDNRLLYAVDTKIHHVESWGAFAENHEYWLGEEADYRQRTIQWGKGAPNYASWKWTETMSFPLLGLDATNRVYDIKPMPGGHLPFDFHGTGEIDLIIGQVGLSASDLLDGFDLEICKASFDGKKFHIPDPHLTFTAKTKMEPNRQAVVGSYTTHYREPEGYLERKLDPIEFSRLASSTISAVRRDVPNSPFYRLLRVADWLPDRYNPNADIFDLQGTFQDPLVKLKHGAPIQFHNWCCKLVLRLRKYQKRGIEVVDAPTIADDFRINMFSLMW